MKQSKLLGGLVVLSLLSLASQSALAGPRHDYSANHRHGGHDQARVLRVKPIFASVLTPVARFGHRHGYGHGRAQHWQDKPAWQKNRYRETERLIGYQVKYRYKGKSHWTQTRQHPGDFIRIRSDRLIAHR